MQIFSQKDKRWKDLPIGNSGLTVGNYGCLITSISSLDGRTPDIIINLLNQHNCFTEDGLLNSVKAAEVLGYNYTMVNKNPERECVVELDYSPNPGIQRHFAVWIADKTSSIMDPWTGTVKPNHWKVLSYRLWDRKKAENYEMSTITFPTPQNLPLIDHKSLWECIIELFKLLTQRIRGI